MPKRLSARGANIITSMLTFVMIFGGWLAFQAYRENQRPLPDNRTEQGICNLWFIGSSSIAHWSDLRRDMAPWNAHNRGIVDALYPEILKRFVHTQDTPPVAIILYAGENDIVVGRPVQTIMRDLASFLTQSRDRFGDLPVLVLSMKPSPARWRHFPKQQQFNDAARTLLKSYPSAHYIDITTPLLKDGRTQDNYVADGIHMNAAGYGIWSGVIRPRLKQILPAETQRCAAP